MSDTSLVRGPNYHKGTSLLLGKLTGLAPWHLIALAIMVAQAVVWGITSSPKPGLYSIVIVALVALFAINIEYGTLAIILVIPWSWQSMAVQLGPVSIKASYILILMGFSFLVFRLVIVKDIKWVRTPLDTLLLVFLAIHIVSVGVAEEAMWSLKEALQVALYVLFYFLVVNVLRTREAIERAVRTVILATVITSAAAVLGLAGMSMSTPGFQRAYAGFTGPNSMANYLLMGLPLAFALLMEGKKHLDEKLPYALATFILLGAIALTYSRAGWIGAVLVILVVVFIIADNRTKAFAVALTVILVLILMVIPPFQQRAAQVVSLEESSNLSHIYLWMSALYVVKQYPVLGIGTGAFPRFLDEYLGTDKLPPTELFGKTLYFEDLGEYGWPAHNAFLQMWAEIGGIGFLVFLILIGVLYKTMMSAIRCAGDSHEKFLLVGVLASVLGILFHNLSITNLIDHFWAAAGIAMASAHVLGQCAEQEGARTRTGDSGATIDAGGKGRRDNEDPQH